jgi:hypothetical protein
MMTGIVDAFADNGLTDAFSPKSLDVFASFEFWTYPIFYIAILLTGSFVLFGLYGYYKDRQDLLLAIEEELKDLPEDAEVLALKSMLPYSGKSEF